MALQIIGPSLHFQRSDDIVIYVLAMLLNNLWCIKRWGNRARRMLRVEVHTDAICCFFLACLMAVVHHMQTCH